MQDGPTPLEIIDAVVERLSTAVAPHLSGRLKFEVRVAARALQLARRDLDLSPASSEREGERLAGLLGGPVGDLTEANRRLCEAIAADDPAVDSEALLAHLRATTLEKLAVDQPDYPPLTLEKGL